LRTLGPTSSGIIRVALLGAVSPVNGRRYAYKTVDAVFAGDPASIVVVTVKVYYHD